MNAKENTCEYIERLKSCGMSQDAAEEIYDDFLRNFSVADLDIYVKYKESQCG